MSYEQKIEIKNYVKDIILRAGQSASFSFTGGELSFPAHHRLFFSCEDKIYAAFKDEPKGEKLYMMIDDSLDTEHAETSRYCLDMSCDSPKDYLKMAAIKIPWQPTSYGIFPLKPHEKVWKFGISVKQEGLTFAAGGFLRFRLEKWYCKEGVPYLYTGAAPDERFFLDIMPDALNHDQILSTDIEIQDEETACIIVTLEGQGYAGRVYFEAPFLTSDQGENLLPEFDRQVLRMPEYAWLGVNLSKREWPRFRLALNGSVFFEDEVFLKIHRYSPVEIDIPDGLMEQGENRLEITYTSDYHDTVPVAIKEISILEKPAEAFSVLYSPKAYVVGKEVHILLETQEENIEIALDSEDFILSDESCGNHPMQSKTYAAQAQTSENCGKIRFEQKGLHVLSLLPCKTSHNLSCTFRDGKIEKHMVIPRAVYRGEDAVISGSGDLVYTDVSNKKAVSDFLEWFISYELGNLVTVRPVYRWGGQRTVNPEVWTFFRKICKDMGFSYVHISDGRDLPGGAQNPSLDMLSGEGFLGRQLHERDGQLFYWPINPKETEPTTEVFGDLYLRFQRDYPETIERNYKAHNVMLRGEDYIYRREIDCESDMQAAYEIRMRALHDLAEDHNTRHTGPSVMFKYFYEQGFDFVGAETMDGALEPQLAFLRGASKAYGKEKYGVHHAVQWSTFPHDNEKRYNRYLLALYLSYMHGVTDINTEEGHWFMEANYYGHHRHSKACEGHRERARRFYQFMQTHTRTGRFYTNTAFLHGRLDGWNGFVSTYTWGMPHMPLGEDGASWQLLKYFYPLNSIKADGMEVTGYVAPDRDKPYGIFSGTPHGNVDVVPIELGDFKEYALLCFAGYNQANAGDFDRIFNFVKEGGILIAGWPHMSTITDYAALQAREQLTEQGIKDIIEHALTDCLSCGKPSFVVDTLHGANILVCENLPEQIEVLERTDSGLPLVYTVNVGRGQIVMVNSLAYPGNENLLLVYERTIGSYQTIITESEFYEIRCGEDVGYTVYEQEDGAYHFYLTPVDWYHETEQLRKAVLRMGEDCYLLQLKFGEITKVVVKEAIAAWPERDEAEVLMVSNEKITVQGTGHMVVHVAKDGKVVDHEVDFGNSPLRDINIS